MEHRRLGRTGLAVSEIGFGTWGLGGDAYGPVDDEVSISIIRRAVQAGVTFFDTSNHYGLGRAEQVLGTAIKGQRERVVITSKGGLLPHDGFVMPQDFSPSGLERALHASLERLGCAFLDVYLLHSPPAGLLADAPEVVRALERFQDKGLIHHYGVSARSPADALEAIVRFGMPVVEVNFNLIDQRALEIGLFDEARKRDAGLIVRTPLCFGYLTGSLKTDSVFEGKDHRANWPADQLRRWAEAPGLFDSLFGPAKGRTAAQFALRFCLGFDAISTVIPGMLTPEHVDENLAAAELPPLDPADLAAIEAIYHQNQFYDPSAKQRGRQ